MQRDRHERRGCDVRADALTKLNADDTPGTKLEHAGFSFEEYSTRSGSIAPAQWYMGLIRRFITVFGPINALMDFSIFAAMLFVYHAGPAFYRSGFFVESFLTQTLII
ncbi:MAG: hypothetical protein NVSMB64_00070 [Candidatus Velthaea sp.]